MNRQRASALRIGLFTITGLGLLAALAVNLLGSRLFSHNERAVMYFAGSIYGLQVGAPVVFRGVRIGSVGEIGVVADPMVGSFALPVQVDIDRGLIRDPQGRAIGSAPEFSLAALVARGLSAKLAQQSLLTGQLYIDLDLRPGQAMSPRPRGPRGMVEIPTVAATTLQAMQAQLAGVDLGQAARDLVVISASVRQLVSGPQLRQTLDALAQTAVSLQRLAATLDRRAGPLADAAQGTLAEARQAMGQAGSAAQRIGGAAERIAGAASRVEGLLAPDAPLLASVQRSADELARSAVALRQVLADDATAMQSLQSIEQTMKDMSRAARATRELAELLERQPDALIRGRAANP